MRAPFDTTFASYAFPIGGIYGPALTTNRPCRLVESRDIDVSAGLMPGDLVWVTTDDILSPPAYTYVWPGTVIFADLSVASVLAIPSGSAPEWLVVEAQTVTPVAAPPYYRYLVRLLP